MASWGDNIGNLYGVVFAIFIFAVLISFFAAGWRPGNQSGGRKSMKGGDTTVANLGLTTISIILIIAVVLGILGFLGGGHGTRL